MSSGEEASIHSDVDEELNQVIEQGEDLQAETEETPTNGQAEDKQVVKPKRVVRNPQPKLNEETLQGPKGIATLGSYFDRVKFKGRGHEEQDLNVIMKTYEYWCHRLFPKFPFDTCIERLEKLGTKRAVQTHIKRIRFDLLLNNDIVNSSDEEDNQESLSEVTTTDTPFDNLVTTNQSKEPELTAEQLERIRINKERAEKLRQEKARLLQQHKVTENNQSPKLSQEEDNVDPPVFDYESNIKGKQIIGKTQSKLSRPADQTESESKLLSSEVTSQAELQSEDVDLSEDDVVMSEEVLSNEAVSQESLPETAPLQSKEESNNTSKKFDNTEDSTLICSHPNSENKENTSLDNIL